MWKFKFPNYVSECSFMAYNLDFRITKKLGFLSYWFIKWIHGEKKLAEMSAHFELNNEIAGIG